MQLKRIKAVLKKEIIELSRDNIGRIVVFLVPPIIMLIFGFGLAIDVEHVPISIVNQDNSHLSRELAYKFIENKRYFKFKGICNSQKNIYNLIRKGNIAMGIIIPNDFEKRIIQGNKASVQVLIDGTFPYRAEVMKIYSEAIINSFNREIHNLQKPAIEVNTRYWFNEELKQIYLTASGTIAVVLAIAPAVLASLLIVKEKETGSIYNIFISPITKLEFLIAKKLFAFIISMLNFAILFTTTVFIFHTPFKGNLPFFITASAVFILVSINIGLLISTFAKNQVVAIIGTLIVTIIPAFIYSGYMTPISSMSKTATVQSHLFPIFYYMRIVKGCYLKASDITTMLPDIGALLFFYTATTIIMHKLFKEKEE